MNSPNGKLDSNRRKASPNERTSNQDDDQSEIENDNVESHLNSLDNTIHF